MLEQIKSGLYSPTHVTDQDVADWVEDYPGMFTGFGSVNLSKPRQYVEKKLETIELPDSDRGIHSPSNQVYISTINLSSSNLTNVCILFHLRLKAIMILQI